MGRLKMREWKNRHGRKCRGGKGGSGNIGTILQEWKMQEWKHRHHFAGVKNAGVETSGRFYRGGKCRSGKIGTILQRWKMREWKHRERSTLQNVMLGYAKKRIVRLISREIIFEEFQRISSQSTNVTNRRTDRRTTYHGNTAHQMGVVSSKIAIFASCGRCIFRTKIIIS